MREPGVGLAWLQRCGLKLVLAGLVCWLTAQYGPGQGPIIINRVAAWLGPPEEPPAPEVLEFGPPIRSVLEFEETTPPPSAIASVLEFEPAQPGDPALLEAKFESPAVTDAITPPLPWVGDAPVFTPPLRLAHERIAASLCVRPEFTGVTGLETTIVRPVDHAVTFGRPMHLFGQQDPAEPEAGPSSPFADPIPQTRPLTPALPRPSH